MSKVEIDGMSFDVAPEVAALLQAVSEERDELRDEAAKNAAKAQVCLDMHDALGVKWGDDPYARIRELLALLPKPDVRPPNKEL